MVKILTVSDLHRVKLLYKDLAAAVVLHKPDVLALVGDYLDALGTASEQMTAAQCAEFLARLPCNDVVFVRGNHEDMDWWAFADGWSKTGRPLNALHGETYVKGPLTMVGFPCALGDETAYAGMREALPEPSMWLSRILRKTGPAMRTLWLMHEPPAGTPLSQRQGPVAGNARWNEAIERFSPWLTVSGHDHQSPVKNKRWHHAIGRTVCVNVGQSDAGPLHYCVIDAEFPKPTPCLPSRLRLTAFPWNEPLVLMPDGPTR